MIDLTLDTPTMWVAASLAAVFAGFIRGFTGFGGPAIMMLILMVFYTPISVLPKVVLIDGIANLKLLPSAWGHGDRRMVLTLILTSALAAPVGYYATYGMDPIWAKRTVALVCAGSTVLLMLGWRLRHNPSFVVYALVGVLSGLAMGGTYIALTLAAFLLACPLPANQVRATMVYWACSMGILVLATHLYTGSLTIEDALRASVVGVVYLLAATVGVYAFRRASDANFRQVVLWLLLALSAVALLSS